MKMRHAHTRVGPGVGDEAEAALAVAVLLCDARGDTDDVAEERLVVRVGDGRNVRPRDHQDVERRLRVRVVEGHDAVVLVEKARRNLARDDPAEDAVGHSGSV